MTANSLTLRTYLYLVILKKFQFSLFYPVFTCASMETGHSCRARWRIAAAAHNLCILIGQIACQSSSLRMVNCPFIAANTLYLCWHCLASSARAPPCLLNSLSTYIYSLCRLLHLAEFLVGKLRFK